MTVNKPNELPWPKILFVCAGNVARSQMAEAYYNSFTNSNNGSSAGVLDFTPLKYSHPAEEVIQAMKEDGILSTPINTELLFGKLFGKIFNKI